MEKKIYPVTIIRTRYQGVYEGGEWAALQIWADDLPAAVLGDDTSCSTWWKHPTCSVAVGSSPQEAFDNLRGDAT